MDNYDDVETRWKMHQGILYYLTAIEQIQEFMESAVKPSVRVTQLNLHTYRTFNEQLRTYDDYDFVLVIPKFTDSTHAVFQRLCCIRNKCITLCNDNLNRLEEAFLNLKRIWKVDHTIATTLSKFYPYNLSFTIEDPYSWPDIRENIMQLRLALTLCKKNVDNMMFDIQSPKLCASVGCMQKLAALVQVHKKKIKAREQFLNIMCQKKNAWELMQLATEATSALYGTQLADDLLRCQECGIRWKQVAFGCGHMMCLQCGEYRGGQCPYCGQTIYQILFLKFGNGRDESTQ